MASIINASSSGSGGIVQTADASGVLQLQRNGTVSVNIDTSGFLLLPGTSGATTNLTNSTFNGALQLGDNLQILNYANGSNTQCQFMSNAYYSGGYKYINTGAGTSKMYVGAAGIWEFAGAAIGTAGNAITYTPTLGCNGLGYTVYLQGGASTETGAGITFPASQSASSNANTLDDYEEGTFTATLSTAATNFSSVSYAGQTGYYTKVGRQVSFVVYLQVSAVTKGGATGNPTIAGLPFTNIGGSPTSCTIAYNANGWVTPPSKGYIESGTSFMYLGYSNSLNSVWNFMGISDVSTGANYVMVAGTYFTS